jgi:hypothetical protein
VHWSSHGQARKQVDRWKQQHTRQQIDWTNYCKLRIVHYWFDATLVEKHDEWMFLFAADEEQDFAE